MTRVINYLYQHEKRLISPIWDGEKAFEFLCMGHIKMSEALGFESYPATPRLRLVKEDTIVTNQDLQRWIDTHQFDYSVFADEVEKLGKLKKNTDCLPGGGCFGPLTVVSGIIGFERMMRYTIKQPQLIKKFVALVTSYIVELAKTEEKEGARFFWIAEPLAAMLVPEKFWEFSGIYLKKIFNAVKIPGFLHVCGKTLYHTGYMEKTDAEVLSIDSVTDIGKCLRMVDENTVIMGNVSPALLKEATVDEVAAEVKRINAQCANYKNFVMSTGCVIADGTPEENMRQIFDITKNYPIWNNKEYIIIRRLIKLLDCISMEQFNAYVKAENIDRKLCNVALTEFERSRKIRQELNGLLDSGAHDGPFS